jgi:hypothetical protein
MNIVLSKIDSYLISFANSVYSEFLKLKYGIESCTSQGKLWLNELRKDIANYKINDDGGALCETSMHYMGWLSVYYPNGDESCHYDAPWNSQYNYQMKQCSTGQAAIGLSYTTNNASANIIEVYTGGGITRINLNATVNINTGGGGSFVYTQDCNNPSATWIISHKLGFVPNVWVEDCSGNDISGTLTAPDNNTIIITFSSAVAGKAYLS